MARLGVQSESAQPKRGGTWSTIRAGRRAGKEVIVIGPEG